MHKRVNLVPQKPLSARIKGVIPVVVLTISLVLVLFFLFRVHAIGQRDIQLTARIAQVERTNEQLQRLKEQIQTAERELKTRREERKERRQRVAMLSRLEGNKHLFSRPLATIAQVLPATIRCRAITFHGHHGTMEGTALDYDDLTGMVRTLQKDPLFNQVTVTVTSRDNSRELERITFSISMTINETRKG